MATVDGTPNIDGLPGFSLQKAAKREEEEEVRAWFAWAKTIPDERCSEVLDAVDGDGLSALHYAVGSNNLNIVKFMVNNGASVSVKTGSGKTVLHHAAENNSVAVMRFLVEERDIDVDIDAPDKKGHTPLLTAAFSGSIEAFQFLMISGANLEATGRDGKTAAILAAERNNAKVLEVLMSSSEGAILCTAVSKKGGNTALHIAASKGHLDAVKVLLRGNVEIDKKGRGGMTAAHMAAQAGHAHVVGELIQHHRASLSYRDQNNDTPLHHACFEGHIEIARKLIEAGAVVNTGNAEAVTPLHIAAWRGSPELVELLLEKSDIIIDPLSTDERIPRTPLFKACEVGNVVVVKMLLQKGALTTGQENRLPFNSIDVAIENGHSDVVLEIVRSDEWRTALRHCSVGYRDDPQRVTSPFRQMIRKMPHIAEEVLNRCVVGHSGFLGQFPLNESEYKITLSFEFFEDFQPPHVSEEDRRRYSVLSDVVDDRNAVDNGSTSNSEPSNQPGQDLTTGKLKKDEHPLVIMVKEKPVLLKHPLVRSLLAYKWQKYGRWVYFLNLFLYLLFLSSLTTYSLVLLTPIHPTCVKIFNNTLNESNSACEGLSASSYLFIPIVAVAAILLSIGRIGVEVLQMITLQLEYFKDVVNWTELILYTFTIIFAWTFNTQCWCPLPWQWQIGAVAVFLSWMALILFFRKLHLTGVYVLMFSTILFTFLKLTIFAFLLVVSFSLSFYMLFRVSVFQISIFTSPGLSLIRVMTMTAGGVDFDSIFASMNSEPFLTYLLWVVFLVLMPVLLANLLIGLAVGDISGIQQAASLRKRILKAELVSSVEQLIPKKILPASVCQWFTVKTEKTVTLNHKFRNVLEELRWKFWGDIHYSTADLFASSQKLVESKLAKASSGGDEMKVAVDQLTKQSQEMKDAICKLSQQNSEMRESMLTLINHNQALKELITKHITKMDAQFQPNDII